MTIEAIKLINQEIEWCKKHRSPKSRIWEKGFIKGLEQAKRLIRLINKKYEN